MNHFFFFQKEFCKTICLVISSITTESSVLFQKAHFGGTTCLSDQRSFISFLLFLFSSLTFNQMELHPFNCPIYKQNKSIFFVLYFLFKCCCEEPTHWKRPYCWERLKAKEEGWQRIRGLDSITNSVNMDLSKLWETMEDRGAWHAEVHGVA